MQTYFWLTTIFFVIAIVFSYAKNRKIVTIPNILFFSTTVSFLLYLQGWSSDFTLECQDSIYYVIGTVEIIFALYALLDTKKKLKKMNSSYYMKQLDLGFCIVNLSTVLLIISILLAAIETLYLTGSLISNSTSDYHTSSMPVVGTIVRGLYPCAYIVAYLDWKKYRKKTTIILSVLCVAYTLLAAGSRFWTTISLLTFIFFVVEYEQNFFKNLSVKVKISIFFAFGLIFNLFMSLGISRLNSQTYAQWIGYTGPFSDTPLELVFSWFYGYFPYSFYNLNTTLNRILTNNINTKGQFLIYPFLSFLHIDELFGIDYQAITSNSRVIVNTAATVATGYFEYFADFGYLFFVEILFLVFITRRYEKKRYLSGYIGFAAMETVWILMSFNNTFTVGITLYVFFFAWVLQRFFAVREISETELIDY